MATEEGAPAVSPSVLQSHYKKQSNFKVDLGQLILEDTFLLHRKVPWAHVHTKGTDTRKIQPPSLSSPDSSLSSTPGCHLFVDTGKPHLFNRVVSSFAK